MAYENILFDLDGTLCDPGSGITKSVQYALAQLSIEEPNLDSLRRFVGPPLEHSFKEYYQLSEADVNKAVRYYREYFGADGIREYTTYPGIANLLTQLSAQHRTLAVVTSKPLVYAKQVLETAKLTDHFTLIAGRELGEVIPKEVTLKKALGQLGANRNVSVMVGDRKHDTIAAAENGIASIGVLYGYGTNEELAENQATHIVKDVSALSALLLNPITLQQRSTQ